MCCTSVRSLLSTSWPSSALLPGLPTWSDRALSAACCLPFHQGHFKESGYVHVTKLHDDDEENGSMPVSPSLAVVFLKVCRRPIAVAASVAAAGATAICRKNLGVATSSRSSVCGSSRRRGSSSSSSSGGRSSSSGSSSSSSSSSSSTHSLTRRPHRSKSGALRGQARQPGDF